MDGSQPIELLKPYSGFQKISMQEIITDIYRLHGRESRFEPRENSFFLPFRALHNSATTDITKMKTHHYLQIVVKSEIDPNYLVYFFNSQLGRSLTSSITQGTAMKSIRKNDLMNLEIFLPPLETQRAIARADQQLSRGKQFLESTEENFSKDPNIHTKINSDLDRIFGIFEI